MRLYILGVKKMDSYKTWLASLPSHFISKYQWGCPYIHTAIVEGWDEDGVPIIWEAMDTGISRHRLDDGRGYDTFYIDVTPAQFEQVMQWLEEQDGKDYDFLGLLGFIWRKNYQNDNKWFCSELIAEALFKAGITVLNPNVVKSWQITPRLLIAVCQGPVA